MPQRAKIRIAGEAALVACRQPPEFLCDFSRPCLVPDACCPSLEVVDSLDEVDVGSQISGRSDRPSIGVLAPQECKFTDEVDHLQRNLLRQDNDRIVPCGVSREPA